jgi:hypothetical protein
MHKQFYFLSPVEVVKVTPQNMEEVAEWCGGKVAQVENKRKPGEMTKFVWVPTPKSSPMPNSYPGMYVTKRVVVTVDDQLKSTFSVFRKDYIDKNYFDTPALAVDATWERLAKEERVKAKPVPQAPKKQPVMPMEKLMGPEYAQDTPVDAAQVRLEDAVLQTDSKGNSFTGSQFIENEKGQFEPVPEKTDEEKLKGAYETIQKLNPGTVIVHGDGKPGPTATAVPVENLGGLYEKEPEKTLAELEDGVDKTEASLFELEYGDDPDLAKRFLVDPYKAPEQQAAARQFLKTKGYHESVWGKKPELKS